MQFFISVENLKMAIIILKTTVRIFPPPDEPEASANRMVYLCKSPFNLSKSHKNTSETSSFQINNKLC